VSNDIPKWAFDRACELGENEGEGHISAIISLRSAFARYIASKEEAPVDPIEAAAEEIAEHFGNINPAPEHRLGWLWKDRREVARVALRRGIELGRSGSHE
jgi:hypothetical protein